MEESWTTKHRPRSLRGMAGQGKAASEIMAWLRGWKKGDALLITGQAGAGKTLLVELAAKEAGLALAEINASDERTPSMLAAFIQASKSRQLFGSGKMMLVDEADGIAPGERGAAGAVLQLIKESCYPVAIIANDPWLPKLRAIRAKSRMLKMGKVPSPSIAKYLRDVCIAEGVEADEDALKSLARWAQGDMRSALGDLQMAAQGRRGITEKGLESLGFRERESGIYDIMPAIMHSGSANAARNAIRSCDKDPDEMLLWIEENLAAEFKDPHELAAAFEIISRADSLRQMVSRQQNWRFKAYMTDLMACVSCVGRPEERHGWVQWKPPSRMTMLGRTRAERAAREAAASKIGAKLHCSKRIVKRDYLPCMRVMTARHRKLKAVFSDCFGLEEEERKVI